MKVTILAEKHFDEEMVCNVPIGTLTTAPDGSENAVCLRTYDGLVSLTKPGSTWEKTNRSIVRIFARGFSIKLTQD